MALNGAASDPYSTTNVDQVLSFQNDIYIEGVSLVASFYNDTNANASMSITIANIQPAFYLGLVETNKMPNVYAALTAIVPPLGFCTRVTGVNFMPSKVYLPANQPMGALMSAQGDTGCVMNYRLIVWWSLQP